MRVPASVTRRPAQPRTAVITYDNSASNTAVLFRVTSLAAYDRALALQPGFVDALNNRGVALAALHRYEESLASFDQALAMMRGVYEVGGKGHSCGIYSFDPDHVHRLAMAAPVSRIMVRQPQSKANAGAFNNGMPMTSSLGCGTWGGNIISENVHLKHYMNTTWVSVPIKEDKPSDEELFGDFYDPALEGVVETITT